MRSVPTPEPSRFEALLVWYARHFPIRRGKLRIVNRLWRAAIGDQGTVRVASLKHGGFRMPCDLRQMLQRQYYFFGTYFLEEVVLRCWENEARNARMILDIGANAGIYSLAALGIQPDATVHAFEPTPEIAQRLRETSSMNELSQLHVHEVAVTSTTGYGTLNRFNGELGENEGMNYVTADTSDSGAEHVQTVTLDQFCQEHAIDHIDLLKLDIQGNEPLALKGASQLFDGGRIAAVFTELNWAKEPGVGCPATESIQLLEESGFRFSRAGSSLHFKECW